MAERIDSSTPSSPPNESSFNSEAGRDTVKDAVLVPPPLPSQRTLSYDDLITLNEEIAAMARAGLPLDQGLAVLAKEMGGGRLQVVTGEIANDLKAGRTLPEALERRGKALPPFYAALVSAGIRSGRVGDVLATMTTYSRTLADLRTTVINAIFYPAMVLLVSLLVFGFLLFFLVPQFERLFEDFRMRLPAATVFIFQVSRAPAWLLGLPIAVIVLYLVSLRFLMRRHIRGRLVWANWVHAVPIVGTLLRSARLAAFTDLLGILVENKVPLPEAFRLAGEATSDPHVWAAADQVRYDLEQGARLGESLRRRSLMPELISWMAGIGELKGTLANSLRQVAEMYRRQVEMRAALLRSVLPPFLIIITAALVVGVLVIAIFLPLFALLEGLMGGF